MTEFVLGQSNEHELQQIPEDVIESVKKAIYEKRPQLKQESMMSFQGNH